MVAKSKKYHNHKYYMAHRDFLRANVKIWKKEHPNKQREYSKKYKRRKIVKQREIEELRKQEFLSKKHPLLDN